MTFKNEWPVVAEDVRPARPDGTCFYCRATLGGQHREGCVIRTRTVVVDVTFRIVRRVPEDWDAHMIEFHMNDSTSCADNLANEIIEMTDDVRGRCLCGLTTGKFVREASEEDERELGREPKPSDENAQESVKP